MARSAKSLKLAAAVALVAATGRGVHAQDNACLEYGYSDPNCCGVPSNTGCQAGYTYSQGDLCYFNDYGYGYGFAYGYGKYDSYSSDTTYETVCTPTDVSAVGVAEMGDFQGCSGCLEFYGYNGFDWESCFGAGLTLTAYNDSTVKLDYDDSQCYGHYDAEQAQAVKVSTHTLATTDDVSGTLLRYFISANEMDGTAQVYILIGEYVDYALVLNYKLKEVTGKILGLKAIPTGDATSPADGEAMLVPQSSKTSKDSSNTCARANPIAGASCSVSKDDNSKKSVYNVATHQGTISTLCSTSSAASVNATTFINSVTYATIDDDTYDVSIIAAEPSEFTVSVLTFNPTSYDADDYCVQSYDVRNVVGTFMGIRATTTTTTTPKPTTTTTPAQKTTTKPNPKETTTSSVNDCALYCEQCATFGINCDACGRCNGYSETTTTTTTEANLLCQLFPVLCS